MANAVMIHRIYAAVGNAVYVHSINASATAPTGNAVLVQNLGLTSSAPTANAGANLGNIEPGATVTLDGSASTASSGTTISTWVWSLVGGTPAPTLTDLGGGRASFTAPGSLDGLSYVFRLTVTDSGGATSTDDTSVQVLNSTEFRRVSGAWAPELVVGRTSGAWA